MSNTTIIGLVLVFIAAMITLFAEFIADQIEKIKNKIRRRRNV